MVKKLKRISVFQLLMIALMAILYFSVCVSTKYSEPLVILLPFLFFMALNLLPTLLRKKDFRVFYTVWFIVAKMLITLLVLYIIWLQLGPVIFNSEGKSGFWGYFAIIALFSGLCLFFLNLILFADELSLKLIKKS